MAGAPYDRIGDDDMTLRDHLAIDRTVLANERTALAYGRTALALLIVGGTCFHFFESALMRGVGVLFVGGAIAVAAVGSVRFARTRRYLAAALDRHTAERSRPIKSDSIDGQPVGRSGAETDDPQESAVS